MSSAATLFRIALRESRAGTGLRRFSGFRIFLLCLTLGVAIVAGIGSIAAAIDAGLTADGRRILGGDYEFRLAYQVAPPGQVDALERGAQISQTVEMRAMTRAAASTANPTLVELKAVDGLYPLFGKVSLDPDMPLAQALQRGPDGAFGAVAEPALMQRLGLKTGDRIVLGTATLELRGIIQDEPDRGSQVFNLGPRLMISNEALATTELAQPGSLIYHVYRAKVAPGVSAPQWLAGIQRQFPDAGWRVRGVDDAASGIRNFIDHTRLFLNLVGLSALLIGGVGIANAVRVYLESRAQTLAILKCVGATGSFVLWLYLLLIARMAAIGVIIGVILGAAAPYAAQGLLAQFDLHLIPALYWVPLGWAAGFGFLTALAFSLPTLLQAMRVRPAQLFRSTAIELGRNRKRDLIPIGIAGVALAAMAVVTSGDIKLALGFIAAVLLSMALFQILSLGLKRLAQWGRPHIRGRALRFALAAIGRPGAPTASIVLSLGLGLTVLVAVMLIQASLLNEMENTLPSQAPSFYFLDIQPNQVADFDRDLGGFPTATRLERVPMLRGRIVKMKDVPVEQLKTPADHAWVLKGDRGVTWSATVPKGAHIVEGAWWPADYQGPPLISLDADTARAFGLKIGDKLSINLLGREITGTIANLREIDWSSLSINFVMVFSPGLISGAPQTHIATIHVAEDKEGDLITMLSKNFPNVSAVRVRDAIASAAEVLRSVGIAVRLTAGIALIAGMLVLAGAMAAGQQRRIYETAVLKVLGGRRRDVAASFLWEFSLLAVSAALIALVIGSVGAYFFLAKVMDTRFVFAASAAFSAVAVSLAIALVIGFAASWRVLGAKTAPYLRNE